MPTVGIGVSPFRRRAKLFQFADVGNKLLIDASTISGSNGDHLATITDASPAAAHFTQSADANRPTLNTSWQGGKAIATPTGKWANASSGIVTGLGAFTVCWVGNLGATGNVVAFFFGDNTVGNGFDFNAGRGLSAPLPFSVFVRAISAVPTDLNADTSAHFVAITYDSAGGSTKW